MSKYIKYQHLEKLGSDEVDGILLGECYVFPKIDGTNAQIWRENGVIKAGSRTRELTLEKDNAGFLAFVMDNLEGFNSALDELPEGSRLAGEWLVPHSLKTYRDEAWRKFYLFDVYVVNKDGECEYLHYEKYEPHLICRDVLEIIYPIRIIHNPTLANIEKCLEENKYLIEQGKGSGEGVVVKNYEFQNKYGRVCWAKMVTNEFKEKHTKEMGAPVSQGTAFIEENMVSEYVTKSLVEKELSKIKLENGWSSKMIPRLLSTVYHCLVTEHTWDFIKKNKNPKIDYKVLQSFAYREVKRLAPELF